MYNLASNAVRLRAVVIYRNNDQSWVGDLTLARPPAPPRGVRLSTTHIGLTAYSQCILVPMVSIVGLIAALSHAKMLYV